MTPIILDRKIALFNSLSAMKLDLVLRETQSDQVQSHSELHDAAKRLTVKSTSSKLNQASYASKQVCLSNYGPEARLLR